MMQNDGHFHSIERNGTSISQCGSIFLGFSQFLSQFDVYKIPFPYQMKTNLLFLMDLLDLTFCSHCVLPLSSGTGLIHWFLLLQ